MSIPNPTAANVLGTAGAVCWSVQLIPQIIVNYRRHHTRGLQPTMMLLWATAGIPLGVYNITQNFNIALQFQPQILTALSLITWAQCKYYHDHGFEYDDTSNDITNAEGNEIARSEEQQRQRWPLFKCLIVVCAIGILMGGIEAALIFALREATDNKHLQWPGILMAVLAALLLGAGVARHYVDIWKERTVRGISFLFVGIDALGDLTSLLSLFFQPQLDVLGIVIYGTELVLWLGVFACGGWYNFRPWLKGLRLKWSTNSKRQDQLSGVGHAVGAAAVDRHDQIAAVDTDVRSGLSVSSSSSGTVFRTASGGRVEDLGEQTVIRLRLQTTGTVQV